ncbi:MAG: nucleotidyltransferase domain-containing protein [Cyanobacteria bacterium P01_D01_bin.1]
MAFPTPLLDARLAREKAQNEQDRQQLLQQALDWLPANAQRYGIEGGYVFGSVTEPNRFTQRSDIDLAVETHKTGDVCGLMSALSAHLCRDVDCVPLNQCHFASKIGKTGLAWTVKD